jgi:hypothetical protein
MNQSSGCGIVQAFAASASALDLSSAGSSGKRSNSPPQVRSYGNAQVKFAASSVLPDPLYLATLG